MLAVAAGWIWYGRRSDVMDTDWLTDSRTDFANTPWPLSHPLLHPLWDPLSVHRTIRCSAHEPTFRNSKSWHRRDILGACSRGKGVIRLFTLQQNITLLASSAPLLCEKYSAKAVALSGTIILMSTPSRVWFACSDQRRWCCCKLSFKCCCCHSSLGARGGPVNRNSKTA